MGLLTDLLGDGNATFVAFADLPTLLAVEYGVVVDSEAAGVANANAINAAIADLAALPGAGGTIELPAGRVYLGGLVTVPEDTPISLAGAGMSHTGGARWGTVLTRASGYTGELINAVGSGSTTGTRSIVGLRDLGINGAGHPAVSVRIARSLECTIDRVAFSNSGSESLVLTNVWNCYFNDTFVRSSGSSTTPAVRMDAPGGEDASNGNFFTNVQWENNNGVGLRMTGTVNFSIVNKFTNCKWEDSYGASGLSTWALVDLQQAAGNSFINCWWMKGRRFDNTRATGPLITISGPMPTNDGERRANIISGSNLSYWGDTDYLIEHDAGALVVVGNDFSGTPAVAYVGVDPAVERGSSVIEANYFEHPELGATTVRRGAAATRSGLWQGASNMSAPAAAALSGTSGQGSFDYMDVDRPVTISALGFHCSTAAIGGTDATVRLALYADDGTGAYPGALVVDGGNVAPTSLGTLAAPISPVVLTPGRYWGAFKWTFASVPTTLPQVTVVTASAPGIPGANLGNSYRGYTTSGLAAGAWTDPAPTGMTPHNASGVVNVGIKAA